MGLKCDLVTDCPYAIPYSFGVDQPQALSIRNGCNNLGVKNDA
jgi:hypothetical protein